MPVKPRAASTQRIPVLVSPAEKDNIAVLTKAAGLWMGEFRRHAAASFQPSQDDQLFDGMIDRMVASTARFSAAIDDAVAYAETSNRKIARLEKEKKISWASPEKNVRRHHHGDRDERQGRTLVGNRQIAAGQDRRSHQAVGSACSPHRNWIVTQNGYRETAREQRRTRIVAERSCVIGTPAVPRWR